MKKISIRKATNIAISLASIISAILVICFEVISLDKIMMGYVGALAAGFISYTLIMDLLKENKVDSTIKDEVEISSFKDLKKEIPLATKISFGIITMIFVFGHFDLAIKGFMYLPIVVLGVYVIKVLIDVFIETEKPKEEKTKND